MDNIDKSLVAKCRSIIIEIYRLVLVSRQCTGSPSSIPTNVDSVYLLKVLID